MNILIAGSTGYLGSYIVKESLQRQLNFRALARNTEKLKMLGLHSSQIIEAQVTDPQSLKGCCEGIDVVISTVGITRQQDGLSYMDVDYQANKNLLEEALRSGVQKFIYVSVLHGEELQHLEICAAKERFVEELQHSGLEYCIIRPSGFFSDIKEFYQMAESGRVYLLGDGQVRLNPIHGADLAEVCIDAIGQKEEVLEVGGNELFTQQEIAELAFQVVQKPVKITFVPNWIRKVLLFLAALLMNKTRYGPLEFLLHVSVMDMAAPRYGRHRLQDFFIQLKKLSS
ncbi:MAG: SDR family oxidoreductase [Bacteroidota bacterium]